MLYPALFIYLGFYVMVLYCKLPTNSKQLPAFPLEVGPGTEPQSQRWEARELQLCHRGPLYIHPSGDEHNIFVFSLHHPLLLLIYRKSIFISQPDVVWRFVGFVACVMYFLTICGNSCCNIFLTCKVMGSLYSKLMHRY